MKRSRELVASCPGCLTLETLDFWGDELLPTLRFRQKDGKVYHDCRLTNSACRLFPRFLDTEGQAEL